MEMLRSSCCTQAQMESATFARWMNTLAVWPGWAPDRSPMHRKTWEFCFIAQALHERGVLRPGSRGLGFAVGQEPLPALFAGMGCTIVATDQAKEQAVRAGWVDTKQHAAGLASLDQPSLCPSADFARLVRFRTVDMNAVPRDLRGFDFTWSACAFEHLGTLDKGIQFLFNMLDCLRAGGVAVHTTEYNVSSNDSTVTEGGYVLYRRRDLEQAAKKLNALGHQVEFDFDTGNGPIDAEVDQPPFASPHHLKLELSGYTSTSIGLIIHKTTSSRLRLLWRSLNTHSRRIPWLRRLRASA
jgi:hypothetical protein